MFIIKLALNTKLKAQTTRVLSMLLSGGTAPLYSDLAPLYYIYQYTMHLPSPFIGGILIVQYMYILILLLFKLLSLFNTCFIVVIETTHPKLLNVPPYFIFLVRTLQTTTCQLLIMQTQIATYNTISIAHVQY